MNKVRLLTVDEMASLPDAYSVPVATEFAKLLGNLLAISSSETTYNNLFADYYLQDDEKSSLKPDNIDVTTFNSNNNFIGLRPVISLDIVPEEIIKKGTPCDDGMLKIEFGFFPQTIMDDNQNLSKKEEPGSDSYGIYNKDDLIKFYYIFGGSSGEKYISYLCDKLTYFFSKKLTLDAGTNVRIKIEPVIWYVDLKREICICKDVLLPIKAENIERYLTKVFLDDLLQFETKPKNNDILMNNILDVANRQDNTFSNDFFEMMHFQNKLKENINLPSIDQTSRIGIFKQYIAEPTDFARLLGYKSSFFLNDKSPNVVFTYDRCVETISKDNRKCGIRPVLSYNLISKYISKSRLTNLGYEIIEFGYYPQSAVPDSISSTLERLSITGTLKKTGNKYITDSVHTEICRIPFTKREFEEYEYEGKRYIRFAADSNSVCKVINDKVVNEDDDFWIEVEPVKWYVDEKHVLVVSTSILASGIQFENEFTVFDFLKKYFVPNLIQYLENTKKETSDDLISLEKNKMDEKEKLGLDEESINTFRSSIKKVSDEEADKLAKKILDHIYNNYDNDGFLDLEYITNLLLQGANINYKENFLIECIKINDIDAIKLFLKAGADINMSDNDGLTPLIYATKLNNSKIVKLLILMGADINRRDNSYATALNYAYVMKNKVIFDLLIQNGAFINTYDLNNLTLKDMHHDKIDTSFLFGYNRKSSYGEVVELLNQAKEDLENFQNENRKVYHKK